MTEKYRKTIKVRFVSITFVVFVLLTLGTVCHGQEAPAAESDTLRVWQSFFSFTGFKYSYGGLEDDVGMSGNRIKKIVGCNPEALGKVETFGRFQVPSFVLSVTSAAVIGWGLGADDRNLVYAGLGGLLVGIVVDQIGYHYLKSGVRIYNDGLEGR